ncbi:hypothetical protein QWZ08_13915 [Ferruginibacter paludis]|uniref:hypothetical protein n=1 Tax=Ferruginibacter paludis TaxID=1310417 RepID=UPI0025B3A9A4|nr:hypothetical protein [Ferruginibacter paludis]MDN3656737.1 hypothetical protein [Ferruginibacter paludis]
MEQALTNTKKPARNMRYYMRLLHNNIGFFIAGLVVIYSLSGILQIYRDTDFLKHDVVNTKKLDLNLAADKLKDALRVRELVIEKTEGTVVYFKDGNYNTATGMASYTTKEWYSWVMPFTELHKIRSKDSAHSLAHYFTTIFGILLLFMSVSAFWMFKPGTKLFSRGVYMTIAGIAASIILLFL